MAQPLFLSSGSDLAINDVIAVGYGSDGSKGTHLYPEVRISDSDRIAIQKRRAELENLLDKKIMYGVNTGCGSEKSTIIPLNRIKEYQAAYVRAHACGSGKPLPTPIVRMMMLLRVQSFVRNNNSGLRLELLEHILTMLNNHITPIIPLEGSVGASGDLIPLAHLGAAIASEKGAMAEIKDGTVAPISSAYRYSNMFSFPLEAKEAMGLTNGSTLMLALAIDAVHKFEMLNKVADITTAMGIEAIRGETNAFDPRIHTSRPHHGQISTADNLRRLLKGSYRTASEAQATDFPFEGSKGTDKPPRVQDRYSFRCTPQIHCAAKAALTHLKNICEVEMNSSTDNPLVFFENEQVEVLSGGNFHGQPMAGAIDYLAAQITVLTGVSDKRIYALLDPRGSYGLHPNLSGDASENTGFMIAQYGTASRVAENRALSMPHCVMSVETSMGQEDWVSMGTTGAYRLRQMLSNLEVVLTWELIIAGQGISLGQKYLKDHTLGKGTQPALDLLRTIIPQQDEDRFLAPDFEAVRPLISSGQLLERVEEALGWSLSC